MRAPFVCIHLAEGAPTNFEMPIHLCTLHCRSDPFQVLGDHLACALYDPKTERFDKPSPARSSPLFPPALGASGVPGVPGEHALGAVGRLRRRRPSADLPPLLPPRLRRGGARLQVRRSSTPAECSACPQKGQAKGRYERAGSGEGWSEGRERRAEKSRNIEAKALKRAGRMKVESGSGPAGPDPRGRHGGRGASTLDCSAGGRAQAGRRRGGGGLGRVGRGLAKPGRVPVRLWAPTRLDRLRRAALPPTEPPHPPSCQPAGARPIRPPARARARAAAAAGSARPAGPPSTAWRRFPPSTRIRAGGSRCVVPGAAGLGSGRQSV